MAFYPILIDLEGASCLVAGGGRIALHKAELLLEQGAEVTVVAPQICDELRSLPVKAELRAVRAQDAEGKMLAVDASGSPEADSILKEACKKLGVPYNCAGHGEACSAIFPAVYKKGRTMIAVSSLGASPPASVWLRDELAAHIPENMDEILGRMAEIRAAAKESFDSQPVRREYFHRCLSKMLESGSLLTDAEELRIREEIKQNEE